MKKLLLCFALLTLTNFTFADHHSLNLEARQPRAELNITSIQLDEHVSIISAEGDMEGYGRVYVTYRLSYNSDGSGGSFTMQGRGYIDESNMASGAAAGMWIRDGHLLRMTQVVSISDGSQNLDVIVADALNRTLTVDAYALKN